MKVLVVCCLFAALCCMVFGDEARCAIASASCVSQYSNTIGSNSSCDDLRPLGSCLLQGGCDGSDVTYTTQARAYGFTNCNFSGAGAVFFSFTLIAAMVSLVQFLTR